MRADIPLLEIDNGQTALEQMMDMLALYGDAMLGVSPPDRITNEVRTGFHAHGRSFIADTFGLRRTRPGAWTVFGRRFKARHLAMRHIMWGP